MLPFATSRWRRSGGMHSAAIACLHSNEHCAIYAYKLLREEDHESPLCVESLLARTYGEKIRQENTHNELTCQEPARASSKTKRASHDRSSVHRMPRWIHRRAASIRWSTKHNLLETNFWPNCRYDRSLRVLAQEEWSCSANDSVGYRSLLESLGNGYGWACFLFSHLWFSAVR